MEISKEENILLNAEKLFSKQGFSGTSTREISKAADVNVSMISYYFGSKEKLYESIFEYRMKEGLGFVKTVAGNTNINAWEKFSTIMERYMSRVITLKDFYLILQREQIKMRNPVIVEILKSSKLEFIHSYQDIISEGIATGIFKKSVPVELLHATISGTLFTAINSLPIYKEFNAHISNYEDDYFDQLLIHLKNILKNLLGYEQEL